MASARNLIIDATLGGGGHLAYMMRVSNCEKFLAFDRDIDAIKRAETRFPDELASGKLTLIHANFADMLQVLQEREFSAADAIIVDLGVSSFQFDIAERGFSFNKEGPLDMRMDSSQGISAKTIVNEWSFDDLYRVIKDFGEEKFAKKITRKIVERREQKQWENTAELAECIRSCIPMAKQQKIHPATRTFQGIRMAVNQELESLDKFLDSVPDVLRPNGVLSIISFHSLEDRKVKKRLKYLSKECICPVEFPVCKCDNPKGTLITKSIVRPTEEEIDKNPRSRSAKLRIFQRGN